MSRQISKSIEQLEQQIQHTKQQIQKQKDCSNEYKRIEIGLINPGNRCYQNAFYQAFFNIPIIQKFLLNLHINKEDENDDNKLLYFIHDLFLSLYRNSSYVLPKQTQQPIQNKTPKPLCLYSEDEEKRLNQELSMIINLYLNRDKDMIENILTISHKITDKPIKLFFKRIFYSQYSDYIKKNILKLLIDKNYYRLNQLATDSKITQYKTIDEQIDYIYKQILSSIKTKNEEIIVNRIYELFENSFIGDNIFNYTKLVYKIISLNIEERYKKKILEILYLYKNDENFELIDDLNSYLYKNDEIFKLIDDLNNNLYKNDEIFKLIDYLKSKIFDDQQFINKIKIYSKENDLFKKKLKNLTIEEDELNKHLIMTFRCMYQYKQQPKQQSLKLYRSYKTDKEIFIRDKEIFKKLKEYLIKHKGEMFLNYESTQQDTNEFFIYIINNLIEIINTQEILTPIQNNLKILFKKYCDKNKKLPKKQQSKK